MPIIQPVELLSVDPGAASNFRININTNFDRLKAKISEIIDNNSSIILSPTQPPAGTQRVNDIWLKELP